jgi:hypothetical protein
MGQVTETRLSGQSTIASGLPVNHQGTSLLEYFNGLEPIVSYLVLTGP